MFPCSGQNPPTVAMGPESSTVPASARSLAAYLEHMAKGSPMLLREDTAARSRLGFLSLDITRSRLCFRPKESVPTPDLGATTGPAKSCS